MEYEARVAAIWQETPTVKSFVLDLQGEELAFHPGQYIDLHVDTPEGVVIGGYSITSSPLQKGTISIAVKKLPNASATVYLHESAQVGDVHPLIGPGGDFYYQRDMGKSVAFIAGGIGVTPFISIINYIHEGRLDVKATLLYSAKTPSELVFFDELKGISQDSHNVRCHFTITRPHAEPWDGRVGRIDAEMLEGSAFPEDTLFFISGPSEMPKQMTELLRSLGVEERRIKTEAW